MRYKKLSLLAGCFLFSGMFAYGQNSDQELTVEEYQLKVEIEKVRERIEQHDKYQQTFIPDSWRVPVLQKMIAMSDWSLSEQDEQEEWCDEFMRNIKTWDNLEAVEPYIMQNNFGHISFLEYHKLPDNKGIHNMPHYMSSEGWPTYCSRGFRVYDMRSSDQEERQDLFVCFDGKFVTATGLLQDKQKEPFRDFFESGIVRFASPNRFIDRDLQSNSFGAGGADLLKRFALIQGVPNANSQKGYKYFYDTNDIFVINYNQTKLVVNYDIVLKEEGYEPEKLEFKRNHGQYINVYQFSSNQAKCVLHSPLGNIEEVMGELVN